MKGQVLLVEDERDTRELLARAIERDGYLCLTAASATEAEKVAHAAGTKLDAVVTDIVLGKDDQGGLSLLLTLRQQGLRAPVVMITAHADVEKVKLALNRGAAHLLEKPFRAAELLRVLDDVLRAKDPPPPFDDLLVRTGLTPKERAVAQHLLDGLSSSEIAILQGNSPRTIRQHVSQIYAKCGVRSRAELFRLAYARALEAPNCGRAP